MEYNSLNFKYLRFIKKNIEEKNLNEIFVYTFKYEILENKSLKDIFKDIRNNFEKKTMINFKRIKDNVIDPERYKILNGTFVLNEKMHYFSYHLYVNNNVIFYIESDIYRFNRN